jgi:hypothetical protein
MALDDWLGVIREAASLGCRRVQFIGGEPTLHPDLRALVQEAVERSYEDIEVFTNATTLNRDLAEFLADRRVRLATSFYSDDPIVHERVTGRRGSFLRTVRGIRIAVEAGLEVRAGVIETEHNRGQFAAAKALLEDLGVSRIGFDRERAVGRAADAAPADPAAELCGQCWRGKLCVTADAKAYPCVFSRFVDLGSPREGVQAILQSIALQQFREELRARQSHPERVVTDVEACEPHCVPSCEPVQSCNPCPPLGCSPGDCNPNCGPNFCAPQE